MLHASINKVEPFQVGPNSAVPRDNPRDSRYKFSIHPPFLKPWSKRNPAKDGVGKPSCFSNFPFLLPFVQHSLFCNRKQISSNRLCIVHHIAQSSLSRLKISTFISCNSNMCWYPHETHFTATSCQLPTFCLPSYTNGWLCSEIFRDSISSSYSRLRSSTFPVTHSLYGPWPLHTKSYIEVHRLCKINSMERIMRY
jgi:hypothetical protein